MTGISAAISTVSSWPPASAADAACLGAQTGRRQETGQARTAQKRARRKERFETLGPPLLRAGRPVHALHRPDPSLPDGIITGRKADDQLPDKRGPRGSSAGRCACEGINRRDPAARSNQRRSRKPSRLPLVRVSRCLSLRRAASVQLPYVPLFEPSRRWRLALRTLGQEPLARRAATRLPFASFSSGTGLRRGGRRRPRRVVGGVSAGRRAGLAQWSRA